MKMTSENDATNVQQFPKAIFEILLSHRSESKQMNVHSNGMKFLMFTSNSRNGVFNLN